MSSSSSYHPPHLHRVNLHSHGKRPFEECGGYDSDPDTPMSLTQPTTSGTSSSTHNRRFPSTSSTTTPLNPEGRNKRARSTSSSNTDDSTSSNISTSSGYNTAQSSSRSDLLPDGPSALPANAVDCPIPHSPPFVTQDDHMSDLHIPISPPQQQHTHSPTPSTPEDTLRHSLQRFADFDRQIAALRTSLAASRSPPLPSVVSSDGDTASPNRWDSNLPSLLSSNSAGIPPSSTTELSSFTVAVTQTESLNSLSTLTPSNDGISVTVTTTTTSSSTPSTSFSPTYSNVRYPPYPSHRPSVVNTPSRATHERPGHAISSISAPPFMRHSPSENTAQASIQASGSTPLPPPRPVNRSLSPLVSNPEPPPPSSSSSALVSDDIPSSYHTLLSDTDAPNSRGWPSGRTVVPSSTREDRSSRLGDRLRSSSPTRVDSRVIREHLVEREPVPSVFDVFNLGEFSQDRTRPPVRGPATSRHTSITNPVPPPSRAPEILEERLRGFASTTTPARTSHAHPQDLNPRVHTSWSSIPSSNSLMSESASERRNALALERFREQLSSFNADDDSESHWSYSSRGERERDRGDIATPDLLSTLGLGRTDRPSSHVLPPHISQSTNGMEPVIPSSPQRSFSELLTETEQIVRGDDPEAWFLEWDSARESQAARERERESDMVLERERQRDRERQRERVWEWERERERERVRAQLRQEGRGWVSTSGFGSRSLSLAREEPSHRPTPVSSGPSWPRVGQPGTGANPTTATATTTTTSSLATNNGHLYSYSNINLSSFQSGLFRDSLRRNVEVDQGSSSASGGASAGRVGQMPVIPPTLSEMTSEASSQPGMDLDDSGSEMDLEIASTYRSRPPSPEWSRPHPYAGRTPPPDYSPPPRDFGLQPRYSVLGSGMRPDPHGRYAFTRTAPTVNMPVSSTISETATPIPYPGGILPPPESHSRPAERSDRDRFFPARILDGLYRSNDDGRRNSSFSPGLSQQQYHFHDPPHNPSHALASGSSAFSRNERAEVGGARNAGGNGPSENRRSSLGLGGSIRSRLARFAHPQSSSNATDASPSRQRSPSHPVGARPPTVEQHRRGSSLFGSGNILDHDSRSNSPRVSGSPPHLHWAMNPSGAERLPTRDVPWRSSSGHRSNFPATSISVTSTTNSRTADSFSEVANRGEERSRLRTLRQRLQLDRGGEGLRFRPGMFRSALGRRNMGDFVPDELFDDSYEALLSLSNVLGEVRSKATPEDVISSLPTGTFKEWKTEDSETRCPICLDDYEPSAVVTKLLECPHWLHKNCLEQWLRTANTCPVCREKVKSSPKLAPARRRPFNPSETRHGAINPTSGSGPSVRPLHTNPQTSNGRPVSFAAMVFDRLMNEAREPPGDQLSPSSPQVPQPDRELDGLLERLQAQRQQRQQRPHQYAHSHDHQNMFVRPSPPHELPYHLRVVPPESGSTSSRMPGMPRTDGPGARPHILMPLRGRDSDSSISSTSSLDIVVDEIDRIHGTSSRTIGSMGTGVESEFFFDMPPSRQRAETSFSLGSSSSTPFTGASVSQQPSQASADSRAPTMALMNSTDAPMAARSGASSRAYDTLSHVPAAPSSSASASSFPSHPPASSLSSIPPRHLGATRRIPTDADTSFEELFGWNMRSRGGQYPYNLESGDEPDRRVDGESSNHSRW